MPATHPPKNLFPDDAFFLAMEEEEAKPTASFALHRLADDDDDDDDDDVIIVSSTAPPPPPRHTPSSLIATVTRNLILAPRPTIAKPKPATPANLPPAPRSAPVAFYHALIDKESASLRIAKKVLQHRTILGLDDFQAITGCDAFPWDTRFGAGVDVLVATPGARVLLRSTEAVPTFRPDERDRFAHLAPPGTANDRFLHPAKKVRA